MTWAFPPASLTLAARTLGGDQSQSVPSSTLIAECPSSNPDVTLSCDRNDEFTGISTYDVGALAAAQLADIYDWYTVSVLYTFAEVVGVFSRTVECEPEGCPPLEDAAASGAGDWQMVAQGSGLDVPMTGSGAAPPFHLPDVDPHLFTLVVNPSPSYPVPDTDGNEAGKVLFDRAQLDALSLTVDWSGLWHHPQFLGGESVINFAVEISAYTGTPPSGWMCVL